MENLNNQKTEEEIIRDIYKDDSDEQLFRLCKAGLLNAYEVGDGTPNPHNLQMVYREKRELERRKADASMLEELEKMEQELREIHGM